MAHLTLCGACERHVRSDEPTCPFCEATIEASAPPVMPRRRLGRAATFAFGAALAGATACGGTHSQTDAGTETDAGPVEEDAGAIVAAYGTPAPDAGMFDAGGGGPQPLYGGAPGD